MAKRTRDASDDTNLGSVHASKRRRASAIDWLSRLSDELIIRILSHLPASQLVICERLSHKYRDLAGDSQLWRNLYYKSFIRPRVARIPGARDSGVSNDLFTSSMTSSRWLDEDHLLKRKHLNWKRQFKLRRNWLQGTCAVSEISVADNVSIPPILVQMHGGVIYSSGLQDGLRAWCVKERRLLAHLSWDGFKLSPPTSLAIDSSAEGTDKQKNIIIGFEDGTFRLYLLDRDLGSFALRYEHDRTEGVMSAVAVCFPYALTMTATQKLSLYRFEETKSNSKPDSRLETPELLHSLKSHTTWPPLSTSLRVSPNTITVSIAFSLPTYLSGWTVGLQEIKFSLAGEITESRVANAIDQHYRPLAFTSRPIAHHLHPASTIQSSTANPSSELHHIHSKPTSLSYTHPYLLVSHSDNTLTLYLVTSTAAALFVGPGSRLWGHTSAISGAHIGGRGKAVSVSRRGDELRVWELEGGFASPAARKRLAAGALSVRVRPAAAEVEREEKSGDVLDRAVAVRRGGGAAGCAVESKDDARAEMALNRGWIGFDEENVVVLKEMAVGGQVLVVYDFT